MESVHYNKYIKYKTKYLELKEQSGGNCEFLEPRKPYVNNYEILQYGVVFVPTFNIDGKTPNAKSGYYQQNKTNDYNDTYKNKINEIYVSLKEILEKLKENKLSKGKVYGYNETGNQFVTILNNLNISKSEFETFFNSITDPQFNYDGDITYYKNKETYFKNLSKTYIDKINNIKTTIEKMLLKQDNNLNNLINTEISNKINLQNLFDNKYYHKGVCSLQNIITLYFNRIIDGLEYSLPAFKIFRNKK